MGFWGGITPDNAAKHDVLWGMLKAGALGFKSFVAPSGINDFPNVSRANVVDAMHFLLSKGAPYFVHAELVTDVEQTEVGWVGVRAAAGPTGTRATRPESLTRPLLVMLAESATEAGMKAMPWTTVSHHTTSARAMWHSTRWGVGWTVDGVGQVCVVVGATTSGGGCLACPDRLPPCPFACVQTQDM